MMTDDEIQAAIETLMQLTKDRELTWTRSSDGKSLVTEQLEGFKVSITDHPDLGYELFIDDRNERAAHVSANETNDYSTQGKLYALFRSASEGAGSETADRFNQAAANLSKRPRRPRK